MKPLRVPGNLDSLGSIREYVREAAASAGLDRRRAYRLELAVDEVATNIVNHGYDEAGRHGDITVRAELGDDALTISLEDTAVPFDPRTLKQPDQFGLPLARRPIGGLGVFLAMENVDDYGYAFVNECNVNTFVMKREPA